MKTLIDVGGICSKLIGNVLKRDWLVVRCCFGNKAARVAEMRLSYDNADNLLVSPRSCLLNGGCVLKL